MSNPATMKMMCLAVVCLGFFTMGFGVGGLLRVEGLLEIRPMIKSTTEQPVSDVSRLYQVPDELIGRYYEWLRDTGKANSSDEPPSGDAMVFTVHSVSICEEYYRDFTEWLKRKGEAK